MNVREIMTFSPITVSPSDSLDELMRTMDQNQLRHLPVVDQGQLVGILSDRDLLAATGWRSEAVRDGQETAGDLISKKPICCSPDDSVVMIAVDLTTRQIGCLPVMEDEKLVGIVTEMDLLQAYLKLSDIETSPEHLSDPVESLMTRELSTLTPQASFEDALELEDSRSVRHIPIVADNHLQGIVSDRDLCRALGAGVDLKTSVSEIMSPAALTVGPREPLVQAVMYLLEGKISALPVAEHGRLLGIISLSDILEHCITNLRQPDSYSRPS